MSEQDTQLQAAVADLLTADERQLYAQLALRAQSMREDPGIAGSYAPDISSKVAEMGLREDIIEAGQRLFKRTIIIAYDVVCGKDSAEGKKLLDAAGFTETAIAGAVAGLLITQLALAPAIATVVGALIIKLFFRPTYNEFCRVWKKNLPKLDEEG